MYFVFFAVRMAAAVEVETRARAMIDYEASVHTLPWFTTQEPAMARSDAMRGMFVWSRDDWRTGTKQFTACSLAMIRQYMYWQEPGKRNLYEIVRERTPDGAPVPAKIHMDCDIDREQCADFAERGRRVHAAMEGDLRAFLVEHVDAVFGDAQRTPLLCMDSSTADKFSMHYVMGGAMFYNSYHVGALMRAFREHVARKYGEPDAPGGDANPYFFESTKHQYVVDGRRSSFVVDMIYTRHRAFRMLGNCKYGKGVLLLPVGLDRARQGEYVFGLGDLRRALVQDPVLALSAPIFAVQNLDGSEPQSQGLSRVLRSIDGAEMRRTIARRVDLATEARLEARGGRVGEIRVPKVHAEKICAALEELEARAQLAAHGVKYRPHEMMFIVPCQAQNKYCPIAGRYHSTSAVYYVVLYSRGEYRVRCHKSHCARRRDGPAARAIPPQLREGLDKFLRARECTARDPVDVGGLAALLVDIEAQIPADYVRRGAANSECAFEDVDVFVAGAAEQGSQGSY